MSAAMSGSHDGFMQSYLKTGKLRVFGRKTATHCDRIDINATCHPVPAELSDRTQLQSAFINIVLNVCDAIPEGGKLIIRS
jgi:signal transduction histidine kinase